MKRKNSFEPFVSGEELKEIRKYVLRIDAKDIAEKMRVSQQTVSNIELWKNPNESTYILYVLVLQSILRERKINYRRECNTNQREIIQKIESYKI